jgi:A/G-specific adenine glycosylase
MNPRREADQKVADSRKAGKPFAPANQIPAQDFQHALLKWYDRHARDLPWRARKGQAPDPYMVWLSEVMLQQTTVKAVIPYFEKFRRCWPTVQHLAEAPLEQVLAAWAGLGYYSRAHNLHACAKAVTALGAFPQSEEELRALPGIGAYTAAALCSIAFDKPATVVDGNVERVMSRLFAVETPLPAAKPLLKKLAGGFSPNIRAGDYAQALMDLGASLCTPRSPNCLICPVAGFCQARRMGEPQVYPRRTEKRERPFRYGMLFLLLAIQDGETSILLRRRAKGGLLGGMLELPGTPWRKEGAWHGYEAAGYAPLKVCWQTLDGAVQHIFTHFHLELQMQGARIQGDMGNAITQATDGKWVELAALKDEALPSVMRKAVDHGLRHFKVDREVTATL